MNFVNNFKVPVELAAGGTVLSLDLPDGTYRLTLSDEPATRWEYVDAVVIDGDADLTRGLEGTTDQEWPVGSVIYCAVTAGVLDALLGRIVSLEDRVTELELANIETRELQVTVGRYPLGSGYEAGWVKDGVSPDYDQLGTIEPATLDLPGLGVLEVWSIRVYRTGGGAGYFQLGLPGVIETGLPVSTLDVEGIGLLDMADASFSTDVVDLGDITWFVWNIGADTWTLDSQHAVTLTLV